jgi:dihydroorotase/N-acyl-D-amino-acid deacylase
MRLSEPHLHKGGAPVRDLLLTGGLIVDGSGGEPWQGDVLLRAGRIASLGVTIKAPAEAEQIDCAGKVVVPGFIDMHSHSDLHLLAGREEKLLQGVTTEVVGNCGFSVFPAGEDGQALRNFANGILCGEGEWNWASPRAYLHAAQDERLPVCGESLAGHGSLRVAVARMAAGALTGEQLEHMRSLLDEAFSDGALGFSTGLMYAPGSEAPREELLALCRLAARRGKLYATHMRDYGFKLLEAIDEQIGLAEESGCRLQISHLQAVGKPNRALNQQALERVEAARERGIDVAFDCYPYIAGSTVMTQLLPQDTLAGGIDALLVRLADASERKAIAARALRTIANSWDELVVSSVRSEANRACVGRSLEAIGEERGVEPLEAAMQLMEEERGEVHIIEFNQSEENLRTNLAHPLCSVISDGFYVHGRPHPRLHGTFPAFLRMSLDDPSWLPLPVAIRKITAQPAERLGLVGKGLLRAGYQADVTVFAPGKIASPASFAEPEQKPVGVCEVIRGGVRRLS